MIDAIVEQVVSVSIVGIAGVAAASYVELKKIAVEIKNIREDFKTMDSDFKNLSARVVDAEKDIAEIRSEIKKGH